MFYVLILLGAIDIVVVLGVCGCPTLLLYLGAGVKRKVPESVTIWSSSRTLPLVLPNYKI
jgi:hypothetical protein